MKLSTVFFTALVAFLPISVSAQVYSDRLGDVERIVEEAAGDVGIDAPRVTVAITTLSEFFEASLIAEDDDKEVRRRWEVEIGENTLAHDDDKLYIQALHAACEMKTELLNKRFSKEEIFHDDTFRVHQCMYMALPEEKLSLFRRYLSWDEQNIPLLRMSKENLGKVLEIFYGKRPQEGVPWQPPRRH